MTDTRDEGAGMLDPYVEGETAYKAGELYAACPKGFDRADADDWRAGWKSAHIASLTKRALADADRIAALEEQVARLERERLSVAPLEWWEPRERNNWTHGARTFFGTYYVAIDGGRHNAFTEIFHEGEGIEQWDGPDRGSLEEAKRDAQADYERRILSALRSRPSPAPSEVVESRARAAFANYFRRNYPGPNTVIYDPDWHAPKLFRAALHAMEQAERALASEGKRDG